MSTLQEDLLEIKRVEDTLTNNKVAKFAYTDYAYNNNDANGVAEYDVSKEQNIPIDTPEVLNVNPTVLTKGYRAKASSITRMLMNHFLGRLSYNLNKVNDNLSNLLSTLQSHLGTANGFASLDENGRVPYEQLPESAMTYEGQWNAQTNTPALEDGIGTKGSFYIVSVAGTQDLGSGDIQFFENDRVIYDGSVWSRLSAGDVKTVNNISPVNGNITLTKGDVGLGNVANTGDSDTPASGGTEKFTTGGAFTELNKKQDKITVNNSTSNPSDTDVLGAFGITQAPENPTSFTRWTFTKVWNWVKVKLGVSNGTTSTDIGSSTKPIYLNSTGKAVAIDDNSALTNLASTTGANMYASAPRPGVTGTLPVSNGGTGATSLTADMLLAGNGTSAIKKAPAKGSSTKPIYINSDGKAVAIDDNSALTNLESTTGANMYASAPRPGVTGTLPVSNGGTGSANASGARTNLGLGSAAEKTAGSAAGNVPLVGTALGTTNNNIVVTDTSGKLKPSGTTIGSAAGKTAGSAAGNVPLIGTALGTTNNNIVVTDTSGKLKPSGTAIGSAAGKTAGSAAGNVPLVGTALGTTDNNLLVTNTSGQMKPFGKTPNQIAYWGNGGGVCSTAADTGAKTVSISGFALYTGVTVKVMFTFGNSHIAPTLNVNSTGAKNIKVVKAGAKITPPVHTGKWRGASSATTEAWQPLTTLELMYDGTDWVIIGNPVVEDYYSTDQSYTVYANGKIEQFGLGSRNTSQVYGDITLQIKFAGTTYKVVATIERSAVQNNAVVISKTDSHHFRFYCNDNYPIMYIAIGY